MYNTIILSSTSKIIYYNMKFNLFLDKNKTAGDKPKRSLKLFFYMKYAEP